MSVRARQQTDRTAEETAWPPTGRRPSHAFGGGRKRRPDRHDEILLAAAELFARQGFHATTVLDIGEAAEVSAPAIYRHFRSKQDLLDSAADWVSELLVGIVEEAGLHVTEPRERLEALVGSLASTLVEEPEFWQIIVRELPNLSPDVAERCKSRRRAYINRVREVLLELRPDYSEEEARLRIVGALAAMTAIVEASARSRSESRYRVATSAVLAALLSDETPLSRRTRRVRGSGRLA
jgi:AcrR family transcriptional regulator